MKSAYVFKLFLMTVCGVFFGQSMARDYAKWHALGRTAYLAYQGNRFDRYMAHPAPRSTHSVEITFVLLLCAVLYEGFAFAGAKCTSLILDTLRKR